MENKNVNILYVDDEKSNLDTFKATFRHNYNVFTAQYVDEAFEIIKKNDIHIAIADQRMPDLSGVQFFEAIMPEYPRVIRMLLTGYVDLDAVIEAINTGRIFRYIKKPWDTDELKLVLDGAAKLSLMERENQQFLNKLQEDVLIQRQMIDLLKNYVPGDLMNEISTRGQIFSPMAGEKRVVSVLFFEIIQFASLIKDMSVAQCLDLLNAFFGEMAECVIEHKGYLNNFLGGGSIALFGAPVSHIDNVTNAVGCGVEMIRRIKLFAEKQKLPIELALGINTGEGIVGNAGSKTKLAYTIYGAVPKVAAQLVEIGKSHPNKLLISETTHDLAKTSRVSPLMTEGSLKYYIVNPEP